MKTAHPDLLAALLAALAFCGATAHAETDVRLTIASAYVHRGIEHHQSSPTYQGAVEFQHAGWFAGLWASTVDFGGYDDRSSEIDYYAGYGKRFNPELALEVTAIRYTFQGGSPRQDDWTELQLSAYLAGRWTVTWGIADNWWATDERSRFLEATYRHPLPLRLTLDLTTGYQLASRAAGLNYGYLDAGVSRRFGTLVVRTGYGAVQANARRRFGQFADNLWTASLTWQP